MCFGCSKEPSHGDGSFENPQHMFWVRNKEIILSYALLSGILYIWNVCKKSPSSTLVDISSGERDLNFGGILPESSRP